MSKSSPTQKSFVISKQLVWEAYQRVKANQGAPGVDGQGVAAFEADLKNNMYRIWSPMSSGSYFPPPVPAVEIPKPQGGGTRVLGVPCDRRPCVASRGGADVGAAHGADLPPRLLRIPGGQVGASGAGSMPGTVLEEGLGARYRHPGVLGCGITLLLGLM